MGDGSDSVVPCTLGTAAGYKVPEVSGLQEKDLEKVYECLKEVRSGLCWLCLAELA